LVKELRTGQRDDEETAADDTDDGLQHPRIWRPTLR
jgi:hypothetical protein